MAEEISPREKEMVAVISSLNGREAAAYKYFIANKQIELSVETSMKLYELYVQGSDCEEIRRQNQGLGLGSIIHARIRDSWDRHRDEYLRNLEIKIPARVMQTQLESAEFLAKMLLAGHKLYGQKLDAFLATGDQDQLKGTPLEGLSMKGYQLILENLMKVTGLDGKKTVEVKGGISVTSSRPTTSAEASDILEALVEEIIPVAEAPKPVKALPPESKSKTKN